jgi:hypothetical protein
MAAWIASLVGDAVSAEANAGLHGWAVTYRFIDDARFRVIKPSEHAQLI